MTRFEVLEEAKRVFGNPASAARWMNKPNFALGDYSPMEMLDFDQGIDRVSELLVRIDHGVYS